MNTLIDLVLWLAVAIAHPFVDAAEPVPAPVVVAEVRDVDQAPPPPVVTPRARPTTPHYAPPAPAPPGEYLPPGEWSTAPDPDVVEPQGVGETIGRAIG